MLTIINKCMDWIAKNVLKIVFSVILLVAFVIKGMYSFEDRPYFEIVNLYDIGMAIPVVLLYGGIFLKRDFLQKKMSYCMGFVIYIISAFLFIYLVPLKPFSDMQHIYDAAIKIGNGEWVSVLNDEYWNIFPANILLGVFWGILIFLLPKSLITIKVINALFIYGILFLTSKICKLHGFKYDKIIYLWLIFFAPLILYINHIYFDAPYVFFCILAIYVYMRFDNIIVSGLILAIASYLKKSAKIFLIALVFIAVFEKFRGFKFKGIKKKYIKEFVKILTSVLICLSVSQFCIGTVKDSFYGKEYKAYPFWNQIYIGLNEDRLGMMDGDFSYERSYEDIQNRLELYGFIKTSKILTEKTFWLWSQGTYQAQRYGFGIDAELEEEKFEYKTFLTNHLLRDEQPLRRMINAFMRNQYLVLFVLMIVTLWYKKDISEIRIWYYIIIATFLLMIIYELKSRYIIHCLPCMAVLACQALENLSRNIGTIKLKK